MGSNKRSNWEGTRSLISTQPPRLPPGAMAQPQSLAVTPSPAPDAALIAAWQRGDEQAAAALVRRHARPLARFLAGAGAPKADLQDSAQAPLTHAFASVARFRGQ